MLAKEPALFMLKCNYIKQGLSYEDYLVDVLNASMFFCQKKHFMEKYRKPDSEAHSECDAITSTYSIDFKLLVNEDVMRVRTKNCPSVDLSRLSQGMVFTKTNPVQTDVPQDTLLQDIFRLKWEDIFNQSFQNDSIRGIIKNLKKPKNLFLYIPYEYSEHKLPLESFFAESLTIVFSELMKYREQEQPACETYICIHANLCFMIFQWVQDSFVFVDRVPEICCSSYMDYKTLALY